LGRDWTTDRKEIAAQAGLDPQTYKGTKKENLIIRNFLLSQIQVEMIPTQTSEITLPAARAAKIQHTALWSMVGLRGYTWKTDRYSIAYEFGIDPSLYYGTRSQNMSIRSWLLDKIHTQAQ
jgi:hypothetical protein